MQSSKSFKDFYSSESGGLQFNFTESADITAVECNDLTGCACGNWKVIVLWPPQSPLREGGREGGEGLRVAC